MNQRAISELKESPFSKSVYIHEAPADLIESIRQNGVLVPIWIDEDDIIISGHRRVNACKKLGISEIPVEEKEYSDLLVIESNRYRDKIWKEKLREAEELERILKPIAKAQQIRKPESVVQKSAPQPKTRQKVAQALNTSHDTLSKAKTIAKEKPELIEKIDAGKMTVNSAFNKVQVLKQAQQPKSNPPPLPDNKYQTLVVDPPWPVQKILRDVRPNQDVFDYPTMTLQEIKDFPIPEITADNAHLYLWTTHKILPDALDILAHWGFKYQCLLVWHKPGGFQPFGMPQFNCEFILFGKKGSLAFLDTKSFPCCFNAARGRHSEKPNEFYDLIQRVSPGPRIDVFARKKRNEWDVYGNEV